MSSFVPFPCAGSVRGTGRWGLLVLSALALNLLPGTVDAQSWDERPALREHLRMRHGGVSVSRPAAVTDSVLKLEHVRVEGRPSTRPQRYEDWGTTRFDEALVGGALGAAVGVPLGILLLKGATNGEGCNPDRENDTDPYDSDRSLECGLARLGAGAFGTVLIGGGGPFGAIRRANLKSNISVWFPSAFSSALLGGSAYLLSEPLATTDPGRTLVGMAVAIPFAALGAAGGAILGRDDPKPGRAEGAVTGRKGDWRLGMPDVSVQWIQQRGERHMGIQVTLLSVEL